ncbi:hypothetical protein B0J13DRAFT_322721 [Dactylonectria estremocensis]|uniref:Uncharacterized protein n=1 Tax=Dactylonectria estremocensis TaxID=1079267 RepID=A0A9P9J3C3_9HYPO|nr:hypothetical protein B0J13DRAFT_322721 [Dactylonectria estremocensis]
MSVQLLPIRVKRPFTEMTMAPIAAYHSHVRLMFELRDCNYIITVGAQDIGFALIRATCEIGGNMAVEII